MQVGLNSEDGLIYVSCFSEAKGHTYIVLHPDELGVLISCLKSIADSPNFRTAREVYLSDNKPNFGNALVGI